MNRQTGKNSFLTSYKSMMRGKYNQAIKRFDQTASYIVLLVLLSITVICYSPSGNLNWFNTMVNETTGLILASVGQTLVLLVQGVDLSIAGIMSLTNCIAAKYMPADVLGSALVILIIVGIGLFAGLLNGFIIVKLRLKSFIVTLATWFIWGGLAICVAPQRITLNSTWITRITDNLGAIPVSTFIILAICLIWVYFRRTYFGVSLYAVDNDRRTAYNSGINVNRVVICAYALSGVFAALSGLYLTAELGNGAPNSGDGYIFLTLCASLIGGAYTTGGRGSILGTIAGCFILQLFIDLILFWGVPIYWAQLLRSGLFILMICMQTAFRLTAKPLNGSIRNEIHS